jgi:hypothetical protein
VCDVSNVRMLPRQPTYPAPSAQFAATSHRVSELRAEMAAKVTKVTEAAAAVKTRVDAIERGGESLAPGYYPPDPSEQGGEGSAGGSGGGSGGKPKKHRRKRKDVEQGGGGDEEQGLEKKPPVWFEGLSALSHTVGLCG